MEWLQLETRMYWAVFTVAFLATGTWETLRPNRDWTIPSSRRWTVHLVLLLIGGLVQMAVRLISPIGAALLAQELHWGIFQRVGAPIWLMLVVTVPVLDLTKYAMHRLFHAVGWLWPVHRVHHSDPDFDVTTSVRFHPVESLLMQLADTGMILVLGATPVVVLVSGVLANIVNVAQHANANLPERWERWLAPWILTARLHRIHHSDAHEDEQRNFGEVFPWWDRLFRTHTSVPVRGEAMRVGLRGYQDERSMGLIEILTQPLRAERKPTN